MMFTWSGEFTPRSLCNWGGGDSSSGDGGGFTGDGGGDYSGATGGDSWTGSESGGGGYFGGDTGGGYTGATGGDSWTGSETGGGGYFGGDTGGGYYGGATGGDSWTGSESGGGYYGGDQGGGYIGPGDYGGSMPGSDFGSWGGPTAGVDYSDGPGWGAGPASSNTGMGNAIGAPGWATGDFGTYGVGGPSNTGFGPGATIGGPGVYAQAPGINGFPGDFSAPPGAAFGMPSGQQAGPQAGPGMPGGPGSVQQGEGLGPGGFGIAPAPSSPVADPSSRSDINPSQNFGPETTANSGFFGPSQAQAASRGTDADIIAMSRGDQPITDQAILESAFGKTGADMTAYIAATNPTLAQTLSQAANNYNADPANDPANYAGPSPSAQQGFTGTSAQQGTTSFDSFAGKGDRGDETAQVNPYNNESILSTVDPMVTQQGYQQLAAEMNARQAEQQQATPQQVQQGYQTLADQMTQAQHNFGPNYGPQAEQQQATPQQVQQGYQTLAEQMQQLATDFGPNYGPQAPGLAPPGQLGPGMVMADPNATPGQQQFGDAIPGQQFAAPSTTRGTETETIGLRPGEDVISSLMPTTKGAGGIIGVQGLMDMYDQGGRPSPSPASARPGGDPFGPDNAGRPSGGRPGGETFGRPGLSITVGGRPSGGQTGGRPGGYYNTGGAGIAPGAKGAEYGGAYGINSPGRPGTAAFGGDFRQGGPAGAYFYDPATGQYYQR